MLIHCPECGREVSDKAKICPHCGFGVAELINREKRAKLQPLIGRVKAPKGHFVAGFILSVLLLFTLPAAIYFLHRVVMIQQNNQNPYACLYYDRQLKFLVAVSADGDRYAFDSRSLLQVKESVSGDRLTVIYKKGEKKKSVRCGYHNRLDRKCIEDILEQSGLQHLG